MSILIGIIDVVDELADRGRGGVKRTVAGPAAVRLLSAIAGSAHVQGSDYYESQEHGAWRCCLFYFA